MGFDIAGISVSPNVGGIDSAVGSAVSSALPDTTLSGILADTGTTQVAAQTAALAQSTVSVSAIPVAPQVSAPASTPTKIAIAGFSGAGILAAIAVAFYVLKGK